MADPFDSANSTIDESRRGLLAAIAQAGAAGKSAYEERQRQLMEQRQAAVRQALTDAAQRGAPAALQDQLGGIVNRGADADRSYLESAGLSHGQALERIGRFNDAYLAQAQAALPAQREVTARELARLRAETDQKAQDRAFQQQMHELELATARTRLEAAQRSGEPKALTDTELKTRLLGAGRVAQQQADTDAGRYQAQIPRQVSPASISLIDRADKARASASQAPEEFARQIGVASGLDPSRVYGLVGDPKQAKTLMTGAAKRAGLSDGEADTIRRQTFYTRPQAVVEGLLAGGDTTRQEFIAAIASDPTLRRYPKTRALLLAEYADLFPASFGSTASGLSASRQAI